MWLTATGAVLLLAAAGLFVAVRWEQIPDVAKLGVLAAVTAACLAVGRRASTQLPVTGRVLHHLGAALLPLDVAAVGVHLTATADSPTWPVVGLATSTTAVVAWWLLGRVEHAPVLTVGSAVAVVPAAVFLDILVGVPAPAVLAAAAGGAVLVPASRARTQAALGWALAAGFAPLLGFTVAFLGLEQLIDGANHLVDQPIAARVAAGLGAAAVLVHLARRLGRAELGLAALGSVALALVQVRADLDTAGTGLDAASVTTLFLAAQLLAVWARRDDLWANGTDLLARVAQGVMAALTLGACVMVPVLLAIGSIDGRIRPLGSGWWIAGIVAGVGWLVADRRREGDAPVRAWVRDAQGSRATLPMLAITAVVATMAADGSAWAVAGAAVGAAALFAVATRTRPLRASSVATSAAFGTGMAVIGDLTPFGLVAIAALATGAITVALAARRVPAVDATPAAVAWYEATNLTLSLAVVTPSLIAAVDLADHLDHALLAASLLAVWGATSFVADRHKLPGTGRGAGMLIRGLVAAAVAVTGLALTDSTLASPNAAAAVLLAAAATATFVHLVALVRNDDPVEAALLAVTVPGCLVGVLVVNDVPSTDVGMALGLLALATAAVHVLAGSRWWPPAVATSVTSVVLAIALASSSTAATGVVVLTVATALLIEAIVARNPALGAASATFGTIGVWYLLDAAGITAADAWAAPVAIALGVSLVVMLDARTSSWVMLGVPIALLASTALAERLAGGPAVHALVAGAVGVASVGLGGWRRLSAPLVLGTVTLGVLVVYETLSFTAGVPTYAWLAAGGSALVAGGVALERSDTSPVAASARLVHELRTRLR